MRRNIGIALLLLCACSAAAAVAALVHIGKTTGALRGLTELHRMDEMRHRLTVAIETARSDLSAANASDGVDGLAEGVEKLERVAERCTSCHHVSAVEERIHRVRGLIGSYRSSLGSYGTAAASGAQITSLRLDSAALATELLRAIEDMVVEATRGLDLRTAEAMRRFDQARGILTAGIVVTFLAAAGAAVLLERSIKRPIDELVRATRAIAAGDLGFAIALRDRTEFGELAHHFNTMSAALRESYARLEGEIEERKKAEARLLHDAFHDALTGLPNRALFVDRLAQLIESAERRPDTLYAVLFVDLDRFKVINDSLGHLVGDHLLVAVSARIAASLRPGDTVARLGGDEFGLLLQGLRGPGDALQVAERVQKGLAGSVDVDGHEIFVTASIGIAVQSERYEQPDQVLRDADIAMYEAKVKGKACYEIFDAVMHGSVVERMQLEADLRRAVEHGDEFVLHYQPIVALASGRMIGLEALVRWCHPTRGPLPAAEFVPLAEESGTMIPLGEWAIATACAQLRAWHETVPALASVTLGLNVSGRQFRRPDCVEAIHRVVTEAGIDPRYLAVEVKESVVMDDVEASASKLGRLREMGIQIHVDDFGTGYSSLSYLHRFPITAVKIDRSFVSRLSTHPESEEVIKAIVSIANSLHFDVVAEGVEGEGDAVRLEGLGCRYAQGYFISRPMDARAVEAWIAERQRSVA
jgi:diguanylate cyclase (GGDEF)-like protein